MLKKGWNRLVKTLRQGPVGFAVRRLSAQEIRKYEKLLKEQRRLAEKASKTLKAYDQKMKKIQSLLGQARKGDVSRVESYIKKLQAELDSALSKAGLAADETADLQREMADWQHKTRMGPRTTNDERWHLLVSELESRGFSVPGQIPVDVTLSKEGGEVMSASAHERESADQSVTDDTGLFLNSAVIYPQDIGPSCLVCDPEQLSARINELSHEIELNQQWPGTTDAESLRLAKQIRNLTQILKTADKGGG